MTRNLDATARAVQVFDYIPPQTVRQPAGLDRAIRWGVAGALLLIGFVMGQLVTLAQIVGRM